MFGLANPLQRIFPQQTTPQKPQPKSVWEEDAGGATDEQIKRLRREAAARMPFATNTGPVQHWTQGLARMAEGLNAGLAEGEADRQERALNDLAQRQAWAASAEYPHLFGTAAPLNLRPQQTGGLFRLGGWLTDIFGKREAAPDETTPPGGIW